MCKKPPESRFRPISGTIYDICHKRPNANCLQSLRLFSGGGGNRKPRISVRIRQLRGITGNRIPTHRNQNTRKSTFGKPFCQVAKSRPRRSREGRTWEMCPQPTSWVGWRARFFRARGMPNRVSWRGPSYSSWHVGAAPSDDPIKRWSRGKEVQVPHCVLSSH